MSFFRDLQTEFEDQECLMGALGDIGLGKKTKAHATKQKLNGYGSRVAEIVIAKGAFGNYYEAGFNKNADGTFTFVSADDDNRFDMKRLKRSYGEHKTLNLAKAQGMKFKRREEIKAKDGSFQTKLFFEAVANS